MTRVFAIFLSLIVAAICSSAQECLPPSKKTNESTRASANLLIEIREKKTVRIVKGRIEDANGKTMPFGLVEVFQVAGHNRERIIGCDFLEGGVFGISGLKKAEYEVRFSFGDGFNVSHIFVRVDPRRGSQKEMIVTAELGI